MQGVPALMKRFAAISGPTADRRLLGQLGLLVIAEQKRLVRRRTGNTARTIRLGVVTDTSVTTQAQGAARYLEYGTRPHIILPRKAKALRFAPGKGSRLSGSPRKGASVVFARRVRHPGTKPYPFMMPGARIALRKAGLRNIIIREWNGAA